MRRDRLLQRPRRQPVRGHVDDVVGAREDVDVPVLVDEAGVAGVEPAAAEAGEVRGVEAAGVVVEGAERGWG